MKYNSSFLYYTVFDPIYKGDFLYSPIFGDVEDDIMKFGAITVECSCDLT